jgi:predicted DNA-binding protein (MmcQ/YjbR family)
MDIEEIRVYCLSLPATTEDIQWGDDLLFRIGRKIYAGIELNPAVSHRLFFKCEPLTFSELVERDGIVPASYIGRYHWVAIRLEVLKAEELKALLAKSYKLILEKLPRKVRIRLLADAFGKPRRASRKYVASRLHITSSGDDPRRGHRT